MMSLFNQETLRLMERLQSMEPDDAQAAAVSSTGAGPGHNSSGLGLVSDQSFSGVGSEPCQVVPPMESVSFNTLDGDSQDLFHRRPPNPTLTTRRPLLYDSQQQSFGDESGVGFAPFYSSGSFRGRARPVRGGGGASGPTAAALQRQLAAENADLRREISRISRQLEVISDLPKLNIAVFRDLNQGFLDFRGSQELLKATIDAHVAACEEANQKRISDSEQQSRALIRILANQTQHVEEMKTFAKNLQDVHIPEITKGVIKVEQGINQALSLILKKQEKKHLEIMKFLLDFTPMENGQGSSTHALRQYAPTRISGNSLNFLARKSQKPYVYVSPSRVLHLRSPLSDIGKENVRSSTPIRDLGDRFHLTSGEPFVAFSSRISLTEISPIPCTTWQDQSKHHTINLSSVFDELESTRLEEDVANEVKNIKEVALKKRTKRFLIEDMNPYSFLSSDSEE